MKTFCLYTLFFMVVATSYSQRYTQQLFNGVKQETVTYSNDEGSPLKMDIYQPKGDEMLKRPVLLYVHGGGFAGGNRDEPEIVDFCKNMARRGMVAVSMSYTLSMKGQSFGCDQSAANKLATFKSVALEIAEATLYLIDHQKPLKIDPELIVLAGSSAGAEAVVHAAYWKATQVNLPTEFSYAGVISMAGALYDIEMITTETAVPTQLFHGTCDNLVPYATAPHHYCEEGSTGYLLLYGAQSIAERLKALNKSYYLITGCNDGHEWAGKPFKEYQSYIADFVWNDVIQSKFRQFHEILAGGATCAIVSAPKICGG